MTGRKEPGASATGAATRRPRRRHDYVVEVLDEAGELHVRIAVRGVSSERVAWRLAREHLRASYPPRIFCRGAIVVDPVAGRPHLERPADRAG